jgi:hypothetical protein
MECCGREMSNFSYYRKSEEPKVPHFYCLKCGSHHHDGINYTKEEWFFYINEKTYEEYIETLRLNQEENDLMQSIHAHEIINHSNPEGELK